MGSFQRELAREFEKQRLKQTEKDMCPFVNGISEDRETGKIKGYCFIGGPCEDATNYETCNKYNGRTG